ncbi:ADP-ribose glycohydrolase MACROD1 [Bombina bombina]|uniref:ADP-ribose glycohydrolase MACROD1 n=1 Tax=Bombina bombina TaxID=8345 RepID=UPI00235B1E4E|nr:ADP-ribose glycohydrolase MACROD1 [Bombina bombina]
MQTISRALREHSVLSLRNTGRLYLPSFGLKSVAFTQFGAGVAVSHSAALNLVALQKFPGEFPAKFRRPLTPRPLTAASWILPPLFIFGQHFSSCHLRPIAQSQLAVKHLDINFPKSILFGSYHSFFWCVPEVQNFSSSSNMAASGKIDLNSPSTSWKEAKNFLKGLDTKKRREHYGIKDYIKLKEIPTWKDTAKKMKIKQPEEVKYPKNKDLLDKISVFRGDITKLELDAIVTSGASMHYCELA